MCFIFWHAKKIKTERFFYFLIFSFFPKVLVKGFLFFHHFCILCIFEAFFYMCCPLITRCSLLNIRLIFKGQACQNKEKEEKRIIFWFVNRFLGSKKGLQTNRFGSKKYDIQRIGCDGGSLIRWCWGPLLSFSHLKIKTEFCFVSLDWGGCRGAMATIWTYFACDCGALCTSQNSFIFEQTLNSFFQSINFVRTCFFAPTEKVFIFYR